jgi:AcrR family transcriptional regulator
MPPETAHTSAPDRRVASVDSHDGRIDGEGSSRAPQRTPSRGEGLARRREILNGAVPVFAALGFAGASLRELAAGAGIQKGHLTYYFRTKEDLLYELIDDLQERFVVGIEQWSNERPEPDEASLLYFFQQHALLVVSHQQQTKVAYDNFRFLSPERSRAIIYKRDAYESRLAAKIAAAREAGGSIASPPPRLLTKVVLAILNWPYQWYSTGGPMGPEELAEFLAARTLASLRP